ncbi:hypothetical protein FRC10_002649 [Ceratobasidium sp. 414]|nr:hypothetical protein FRC10_002649 [Ceratobasidium sp. 414]
MLLISFIPVTPLTNITDTGERSKCGWQLFHACMESILEPLKVLSRVGMEVLCADGGVRRVFPILAAYLADFPEQVTITCVRDSGCLICWVPGNERANLSARFPMQDRCRTLDALHDHWNGYSCTIKDLGIRPTRPFWANLPHVNISGCLTPDLLHQLDKGVLGDHIVKWCTALLGVNEMDHRAKGMPRFQNLRYFKQGISVISQWTGKEAKALASTLLLIVAGYPDSKVVTAVRCILDFSYHAHLPELSEEDLKAMESDLEEFETVKSVFVDKDVKGLLPNEQRFHRIPKIHMLLHYCHLIRELGAAVRYSTKITERLHIDCMKEPWRATNHVNPIPQMISYLEKKEAWTLLRTYLHDARLVIDKRFQEMNDDGGEDEDDDVEEEEVSSGRGGDGGRTWQPRPMIFITKRPALSRKQGAYLIEEHKAVDLIPAITRYLHSIAPETPAPVFEESFFTVWKQCKLHHRRLPFYPALDPQTNSIHAFPSTIDKEGWLVQQGLFDVVLFLPIADDGVDCDSLHQVVP